MRTSSILVMVIGSCGGSTGIAGAQTASPAGSAKIFAEGIVSTGKEFTVTFDPSGREVYFTRYGGAKPSNHVMVSRFDGARWLAAEPVTFSADQWADLDPAVSPDGNQLFFVSTRPVAGKDSIKPDMDIWVSTRTSSGWGPPSPVEGVNSTGKEGSPTVDRAGNLYFFSDRGRAPNENSIWVARRSGNGFRAPEKLPSTVNAGPSDTSPFVSADGATLLFYSTRDGGAGKADLYFSTLGPNGWTAARSLGPAVNTPEFEFNASVSRDGRILYFGRGRTIWEIPLADLGVSELEPTRFTR